MSLSRESRAGHASLTSFIAIDPGSSGSSVCETLVDSMKWCADGLSKVAADPKVGSHGLIAYTTNRKFSTSSAFSGIGAPEVADFVLEKEVAAYLESCSNTLPANMQAEAWSFQPEWAIEVNKKSLAELRLLPKPPKHLFGDLGGFCPSELSRDFKRASGREGMKKLRRQIRACVPNISAYCYIHGCHCTLEVTDLHRAGSHCTMHSSMGKQEGEHGSAMRYFFLWAALMRRLRPNVIMHENVKEFGCLLLKQELGGHYIIIYTCDNARHLGWPGDRVRQIAILILKCFWLQTLKDNGATCSPEAADKIVGIQRTFRALFYRRCSHDLKSFLIGSYDDVLAEMQWSSTRPGVRQRHALPPAECEFPDDLEGSCRHLLTLCERRALAYAERHLPPGTVVDVCQNPVKRFIHSRKGCLMTLIANLGFLYITGPTRDAQGDQDDLPPQPQPKPIQLLDDEHSPRNLQSDRWMLGKELLTAMAFPISAQCQAACHGAYCQFSDGRPAPATRTVKSTRKQSGNTIHVNHIGAMTFVVCLKFPTLGQATKEAVLTESCSHVSRELVQKREEPNSSSASSASASTTPSSFEALFVSMRRSRIQKRERPETGG